MNTENKNKTNNQDTVEQNQNGTAPATSEATTGAELITSSALVTGSSPSAVESANPTSDPLAPPTPVSQAVEGATQNPEPLDRQMVPTAGIERETHPATPEDSEAALKCPPSPCSMVPPRGPCRTRRSKIASLPPELRQWVNEQLVLQTPTKYIIDCLNDEGHPGITQNNVSKWRTGGFQDYLKEAEIGAERDKRWNSLVALARAQGSSVSVTSVQMALSHHHQLLASLDLTDMSQLLAEKPEYFFRLNTSLSHLIRVNEVLRKNSQSIPVKPPQVPTVNSSEEREATGGLTLEARDKVRKKLGIRPPPEFMLTKPQPDPAKEGKTMAQTPNTEPA